MTDLFEKYEIDARRQSMVNFYEGRLWFAPHVLQDIEDAASCRFESENPREFGEFVIRECQLLQNTRGGPRELEHAFNGFCTLKLLQYLVDCKLHGEEVVGQPPHLDQLVDEFRREPSMIVRMPTVH